MPIDSEALFSLIATATPPELGPERRTGTESAPSLNRKIDAILANGQVSGRTAPLIRALVLLWHDHLEDAHVLAQEVEGADGALVHGIMHRREPDYGNAAYWFRRVGKHPAFGKMASTIESLPGVADCTELRRTLLPDSGFDPFGFIELCERHARGPEREQEILRAVQGIETRVLLEGFVKDGN